MVRVFLAIFIFLGTSLSFGAEPKDFTGTWGLRLGERNILLLSLEQRGSEIYGKLSSPKTYGQSELGFSEISHEIKDEKLTHCEIKGETLHFSIEDTESKEELHYSFTAHGTTAELRIDEQNSPFGRPPYPLERVSSSSQIAKDWEPNRLYTLGDGDKSNPELIELFNQDQQGRTKPMPPSGASKSSLFRTDKERRDRTHELLAAGALHTGQDYFEAALIFQHSLDPDDYLLAHTLAMIAMSKGNEGALWLATATLDRYLQSIGKPQIYGTQYKMSSGTPVTQEPYNRTVISDVLRRQLTVPIQAVQEERRKVYEDSQRKK